jgi:hypothetical protein
VLWQLLRRFSSDHRKSKIGHSGPIILITFVLNGIGWGQVGAALPKRKGKDRSAMRTKHNYEKD